MDHKTYRILSTRPLDAQVKSFAASKHIMVDEVSFIETIAIKTPGLQNEINDLATKDCLVVFTSMNAVNAVTDLLDKDAPNWKYFCTGNTTRQLLEEKFGAASIAATGNSAGELADNIINWKNKHSNAAQETIFFCGDQRRDELPNKLLAAGIELQEIETYHTIETSQSVNENYDGILFFSPSAARSFFAGNTAADNSVLFAIGETTGDEIKKHCHNKLVIGKTASKNELAEQAILYFVNTPTHK